MALNAEAIERQILAIRADPLNRMTQQEIAELLGISRRTVNRVVKKAKPDLQEITEKLGEYQRQIASSVSIQTRVARLKALVEQDAEKMVALKAIQRIDELDGIVTEREKGRYAEPPREATPMFMLPPGATVTVTMARKEIDVTPQGVVVGPDKRSA